jgi:Domain of unknown function (DUF1918)
MMDAEPGDELVVDGDGSGRDERVGLILGIPKKDGHAAYLVHWIVGDYDSLISPWPAVHIRHRENQTPTA